MLNKPLTGIDISSWQAPASVNWHRLRELGYSFAYIRGVKMGRSVDVHAAEHVQRARDGGFRVGLYSFFHPAESVDDQVELAADAHAACGLRVGDLAPALDVESIDHGPQACPAWVEPAHAILEGLEVLFQAALRYHNVRDWVLMGRPTCLERWHLWLADYTAPADLPCVVWQQRSAPIAGYGTAPLDQNAALGELPTIGPRPDAVRVVEPDMLGASAFPWPRWDPTEHARIRNRAASRIE